MKIIKMIFRTLKCIMLFILAAMLPWLGTSPVGLFMTNDAEVLTEQVVYESEDIVRLFDDCISVEQKSVKVLRYDPEKPMVALTFDDGPRKNITNSILDILEEYDARATFFLVGQNINSSTSDDVLRMSEMDCEIGNHTYRHSSLTKLSKANAVKSLDRTSQKVADITGEPTTLLRPPYGYYRKGNVIDDSYAVIEWSVDPQDWRRTKSSTIVRIVKANVQDGDIILLHDTRNITVNAVEVLVPWLIEEGYQLVTVSELMEAKGIELERDTGRIYYSANKY